MARTTNRRSRTTRGRTTANRFAPSLNTSRGLYNLATKTGLQQQADNIIAKQQGETNQLFSGGLVSDFFDVLNAVDYGVVGMLKGQSFLEGMKNRESFADEDAIGKNLTGKILGTMLDIGVDPLTYIAPLTILKKVPGLTKLAKFAKTAVFGKKVKKVSEVTGKTFEKLEGGLDSAKFFAKKLTYMFGKDPVYRKAWEESEKGIATGQTVIKHMTKGMLNLDNKSSVKLLELGEDFRFDRVGIEKLKGQFSDKQIRNIDNFGKYIDELGRQQVDLGLLSKSKYEKNKGKYLKAFYEKHELSKPKGIFGFGKKKVVGNKARKNLTPEQIEELVRIENPAYIFSRTAMDMLKDIENTKFYNEISKKFASNVFEEGFEKLPISSKLFTTATGEKITMLSKIKNLNSDLKPVFKQLKQTFKADKNVLSQVGKLEKELGALKGLRTEEFNKFFQEGRTITKEVGERGVKTGIPVVEKLPKDLFDIAQDIKKGVKYDDIKLEKLFEEGVLERNGFKSIKDFVDYIKKPAEIIPAGTRIIEDRIFKLNELIDLAKTEKSIEVLRREIGKGLSNLVKKEQGKLLKKSNTLLDIPGLGRNTILDLQKLGIKSLDDLINSQKTGKFVDNVFRLKVEKVAKLLGKNTPEMIRDAERLTMQNDLLKKLLPKSIDFTDNIGAIKKLENLIKQSGGKVKQIEKTNLEKLVNVQKQIENLVPKASKLRGIDKRSIDDSFRFLEDTISKITAEKEGLVEQIGKVKLGELSGKFVPKQIHDDITELTRQASDFEKWNQKLTGTFKQFKVILNPASHFRNIMSNKLLNNFDEAGMPLWRLDKDIKGWKSVITEDKWFQEVQKMGGAVDTFKNQELGELLKPPKGLGKLSSAWNKTTEFLGDMYQKEEMGAKMSMYIFQRTTKGLGKEEAWKIAERATFNYARVTPFVRKLRSNAFGFPFITFTVKSTPIIAKTALTHPTKISNIGKIRNTIEKLSNIEETEAERASEPPWVKNGFYVKLPFKDENDRSAYFDLTYILPFGDLVNLGEETNLNIFKKSPAINLITELGNNKDFYGNNIWRESDSSLDKNKSIMRHLAKSILPPPVSDLIPGGFNQKTGEQRPNVYGRTIESSSDNQNRTLAQEMFRQVGMKIQPVKADIQENFQEWNTKRELETLLREQGSLGQFDINYIPKK